MSTNQRLVISIVCINQSETNKNCINQSEIRLPEVEIKHETELVQLRDLGQYRVEEGHLAVLDAALKASEVIKI